MEELDKVPEIRMYFFVPYNISEIQKGIQAGHAALRYARKFSAEHPEVWDFVDNHETWIVLDGGTMNDTRDFEGKVEGSMNQLADGLMDNDINFSYFLEPDLNSGLSALCFLCEEQVFNFEDFPDFVDHIINTSGQDDILNSFPVQTRMKSNEELIEEYPSIYKEWVRGMGGVKNVFLRSITEDVKKA